MCNVRLIFEVNMKNIKMIIQYDGTNYKGWQVLKNDDKTIQGKLQNILTKLTGAEVDVIGSGRTDAGVHARGQVANAHLNTDMSAEEIKKYINKYLPDDIAVITCEDIDDRFHARYNAAWKTYSYRINMGSVPNVFEKRFVYQYGRELNTDAMKEAAGYMTGTRDYTSFCGNSKFKKSAVRTVSNIDFKICNKEVIIYYTGDGFLQNMVRIMTGTLIEVGNGTKNPKDIPDILKAKRRELAGYTAPPQGLVLEEVKYDNR